MQAVDGSYNRVPSRLLSRYTLRKHTNLSRILETALVTAPCVVHSPMVDTDRKRVSRDMPISTQPARAVKGELIIPDSPVAEQLDGLPPIFSGAATPAVARKVHGFYLSVAAIFERWVARRSSQPCVMRLDAG